MLEGMGGDGGEGKEEEQEGEEEDGRLGDGGHFLDVAVVVVVCVC